MTEVDNRPAEPADMLPALRVLLRSVRDVRRVWALVDDGPTLEDVAALDETVQSWIRACRRRRTEE